MCVWGGACIRSSSLCFGFSSCSARALSLGSTWDLSSQTRGQDRTRALEGRFSATGPAGKSLFWYNFSLTLKLLQKKKKTCYYTPPSKLASPRCVLVAQSCLTLSMDCSPPGSSVHEIFQARILERVAISFSRGSSQPRDRTRVSCTAGRSFTNWATRDLLIAATVFLSAQVQKLWDHHGFFPSAALYPTNQLLTKCCQFLKKNIAHKDFPGGPVAKTLCSQCRVSGFHPWSGN